ncbi:hypothetical protein BC829DRAFT_396314, partial [Chytridium lagenaria]
KGGCRCADQEPDACDISVGSVSAGVALDGVRVGSGSLTPLRLGAVAFGDAPVVSLGGLVLVEAGSPAATIDHLSNVTISVPVSLLSSVLPTSFTEGKGGIFAFDSTSWLDLSPVLPNSEIVMAVSADYFNPLGVGASLPYGGASVGLTEDPAAGDPGSGSIMLALHDAISVLLMRCWRRGKYLLIVKIPTGSLVYGGSATDIHWIGYVLERCELGDIISSIINRKSFEIVVPEIRIRLPFGVNGNVGYASFALGVNGRPLVEVLAEREDVAKIFKAFLEERIGIDFIQCLVRWAKVNLERVILGPLI